MRSCAPTPSIEVMIMRGFQLTQTLECCDAFTPRPCGEGVLVWCCGRLHRGSELLGHRPQELTNVGRRSTSSTPLQRCLSCTRCLLVAQCIGWEELNPLTSRENSKPSNQLRPWDHTSTWRSVQQHPWQQHEQFPALSCLTSSSRQLPQEASSNANFNAFLKGPRKKWGTLFITTAR